MWWFMELGDDHHLYNEDGDMRGLTPGEYVLPFGKYEGLTLAEVTDRGYLEWLLRTTVEKPNWYLQRLVTMRLEELT